MAENPDIEPQKGEPPAGDANQKKGNAFPSVSIRSELNIPPSIIDSYKAEQGKQESREQRKFKIEVATLIVIVVYTVIAGYQGYQMRLATSAATTAANIARDTLVTSQRPWLGIEGKPIIVANGERWQIEFKVRNYGLSPALHAAAPAEPSLAPLDAQGSNVIIEGACLRGENLTTDPQGHGYTIFPNSSNSEFLMLPRNARTTTYLLGCLTYLDQFGKTIHHTRFCAAPEAPLAPGIEFKPCFGGQDAD